MKKVFAFIATIILFTSCEKNIDFNLKNADNKLVVDAEIENDKFPTVILTKNFDFFSKIDPQLLANAFVHNAEVTISNGNQTDTLKELAFPLPGGYMGYVYSIDTLNPGNAFKGEFAKKYDLKIIAEGKEYLSSTNIPALTKYPDSIWFKPAPLNPDSNARVMVGTTTDPPGLGNYIRYFTKINDEPFLPGDNSVFDDAVIDGTTYTIQVEPGIDRNSPKNADDNYFRKDDMVTVKLCNIDKATYTFWNTWEFAYQSIGNPFSQPNKVIGNVSNNALGAFCGYAAWYKTLLVK